MHPIQRSALARRESRSRQRILVGQLRSRIEERGSRIENRVSILDPRSSNLYWQDGEKIGIVSEALLRVSLCRLCPPRYPLVFEFELIVAPTRAASSLFVLIHTFIHPLW